MKTTKIILNTVAWSWLFCSLALNGAFLTGYFSPAKPIAEGADSQQLAVLPPAQLDSYLAARVRK